MSQPSQNPSQQPISFKTVPGRNRTQKWTQAKTNNYDGDDWGGYDDYDDYGGAQELASARHASGPQLQRQSSFDRGVDTERRQFSSGTAIYEPERLTSPSGSGRGTSQDGKSPDEARRRMREFSNPGQVPQPLNTPRSPETPRSVERPPRKSSLVSGSPAPDARATPAVTSPSLDKPLPFVRPSDIYKRMAEEKEKERQSMESGRPSMESIQRESGSPSRVHHTLVRKKSQESLPSNSGRRPSLDPVSEANEPKLASPGISLPAVMEGSAPNLTTAQPSDQHTTIQDQASLRTTDLSPRLPPVSRVSDFGSFMPRDDEEERISAAGLAAATAAANASAMSSSSRDITPTMPAHQIQSNDRESAQSSDPAADIAAERSTIAPFEQIGRVAGEDPSGLSHQPSSGFRSVVHKAFDRQGDDSIPTSPISRDNDQSAVSRSNTDSTRSISPIMSRVPSVATAQQKQQERDAIVPSIAEEAPLEVSRSRTAQDSTAPPVSHKPSIIRKPTPSHSRNVSSEIPGFTPGYRRSMDTPSPNNSPARTPGLGDTDSRRLSGPMSAMTVNDPEAPDVDPAAPEMASATLEPAETPLETPVSTHPGASGPDVVKPLPTTGRERSGTDYSLRESDLAREANASPQDGPAVAEAAKTQQNLFLDTHPSNPSSPTTLSPSTGIARPFPLAASSGSGRNSPAGTSRSKVRSIVDQFHQINEDSRRNSTASSKSSWSNFGGDDENLPGLNRRTTGGSALSQSTPGTPGETVTSPSYDRARSSARNSQIASSPSRPGNERLESFKPHLPGEWISAAPTPAGEVPGPAPSSTERGRDHSSRDVTPASPPTPRGQPLASPDEEVDLTPTTRKTKLHGRDSTSDVDESQTALSAVKNAGDALGTAFMSSIGYGHQTQDFANKGSAAPVDVPEMRPHRQTGNIEHLNMPILRRGESDAPSDGTNSVANSVPPTPPTKDTPQPPGLDANSGPVVGRPVSNYFAGVMPNVPAPLSFGKHSPNNSRDFASSRPTVLHSLSTDTRATDFESDRLRKDIVRSLGPEKMAELKRESILEDADRTQDALDAPVNQQRVASGDSALPAAEVKSSDARSGLPSQARPGLLDKRFSWENKSSDDTEQLPGHIAVVGEIEGDENRESYERPKSNQGLRVVNTQDGTGPEPTTANADEQVDPHFMLNEPAEAEKRLSSALPVGTAALALGSQGNTLSEDVVSPITEHPDKVHGGLDNLAPTPMVEDFDGVAPSAEPQSPGVPHKDESPTVPSATPAAAKSFTAAQDKIPAFRDLAAIKNTDDRIAAYENTRQRFADMNTGLPNWLSGMLATHPEYANAGNEKYDGPAVINNAGLTNTISGLGGNIRSASHKHSPSVLKIGGERKASNPNATAAAAPASNPTSSHADVEKIQAKGKDFMKSAGAGAKGLFAKGKSRFGRSGEKGASSSVSASPIVIAPGFASSVEQPSSNKNLHEKEIINSLQPPSAASEKAQPSPSSSRPITPTGLQTVNSDAAAPAADRISAAAERPRSVFGRLRDVSRSNTRSRSRPGSVVFGGSYGDSNGAERKSPGPSRTVSRAASMIFGRGEDNNSAEAVPPLPVYDPQPQPAAPFVLSPVPVAVADADASAGPGSPGVLPGPMHRRREMWEDDGAEVGDAAWRDEHARLGVLPSPSVQESVTGPEGRKGSWVGEPVEPPLEEKAWEEDAEGLKNAEDVNHPGGWKLPPAAAGVAAAAAAGVATAGVATRVAEEDARGIGAVQTSTTQDEAAPSAAVIADAPVPDSEQHQSSGALPISAQAPADITSALSATAGSTDQEARRSSLDNFKVRRPSVKHTQSKSASHATPAPATDTATRPLPERKFSALEELPSQQRRRQFTPAATPRRMSLVDDGDAALEPMPNFGAIMTNSPRSNRVDGYVAPVLDLSRDNMSEMVKPAQAKKISRPATPANWDKLSVVSAPKGADDAASRRSSVSSLGDPQSPDTVVIPAAASQRQSTIDMPTTTATSSTMDNQQRSVSPLPFQQGVVGSSVPTMEPDSMLGNGRPEEDGFMNRDYRSNQQRPMSYMPHSRGSSSVLTQDAIDLSQTNKRFSTPGAMSDYSAFGAGPYDQQGPVHPRSRAPSIGYPPSEYDKLRSPQAGDADPVVGENSSKRSSGFFRGPGPEVVPPGALGTIPSPSKLDENYNGLIDPQVSEFAEEIAKTEQQQPQQKRRKSGIMNTFRRSSVHSSANPSRPSSRGSFSKVAAANANESALAKSKTLKKPQRAPSSAVEPPKNKRFSSLGSLFRRSSTMSPRSSTQLAPAAGAQVGGRAPAGQTSIATASKPPKKLTKTQPPQQYQHQQQHQQQRQQYSQQPTSYYTGPSPGNYAAYEAVMRQQAAPGQGQQMPRQYWQQQQQQLVYLEPAMMSSPYQQQVPSAAHGQRHSGYYQQGPPQAQYQQYAPQKPDQQYQTSVPNSRTHSLVSSPVGEQGPPFEYYGSREGQPSVQGQPQMRRLHSEGHWRRDTVPDIPEANSPVDSSKGASAGPARAYTDGQSNHALAQGSPQSNQPGPSRPVMATRQSSNYSQASVVRSPGVAQDLDDFSQAHGRQDYQAQHWQQQQQQQQYNPQRKTPTLPQLQTQAPSTTLPTGSVGSIDQQMARSPAHNYQDQQTPWSISLPPRNSSGSPNASSWGPQSPYNHPQEQYSGAPAAARGAVRPHSQYQDQYSSMTPYQFVPPRQMQHMAPQSQHRSSFYGEQVSSPATYTPSSPHQTSSPAPYMPTFPHGHDDGSFEQHQHHSYTNPPPQQQMSQPTPPQHRYYNQSGAPRSAGSQHRQISYDGQTQARPLTYQRTPSGFSGRRDDATVSEAELVHMRGTSYPGQEWAPPGRI